jgi:hypothetical protein
MSPTAMGHGQGRSVALGRSALALARGHAAHSTSTVPSSRGPEAPGWRRAGERVETV